MTLPQICIVPADVSSIALEVKTALFPTGSASQASKNVTNEKYQNFDPIVNLCGRLYRQRFFLQVLSCAQFAYPRY